MRRKRRGKSAPPVRLPDEVTAIVTNLAGTTGWSESEALAFLVNAGWNAVSGKGDQIPKYREFLKAAVEHHEAEIAAKKKLAATGTKLREAKRVLTPPTKRR